MSIMATITPIEFNNGIDEVNELKKYARRCVHHGLNVIDEGSPFHPYLMYHQMFNPNIEQEQQIIKALGSSWLKDSKEINVYSDLGINQYMIDQINDILDFNPATPIYITSLKNKLKIPTDIEQLKEKQRDFLNIDQKTINDYILDYEFSPKSDFSSIKGAIPNQFHFKDFEKVIMESPFAGDVKNNVQYAKNSIRYLATKLISASASHLIYTQMLDDTKKEDRDKGIDKGIDIAHNIDSIFMVDRGLSGGMKYGYDRAKKERRKVGFQTLSENPTIIQEVQNLKNWDEAERYIKSISKKNDKLFQNTGYIIDDVHEKIKKTVENKKLKSKNKKAPI